MPINEFSVKANSQSKFFILKIPFIFILFVYSLSPLPHLKCFNLFRPFTIFFNVFFTY